MQDSIGLYLGGRFDTNNIHGSSITLLMQQKDIQMEIVYRCKITYLTKFHDSEKVQRDLQISTSGMADGKGSEGVCDYNIFVVCLTQ